MEREKLREEVIPAYHEFRDKAVNQTLTLLYGEHAEARAVAKGVLADLFDMGMSEQKRAASVDRKAIAFRVTKRLFRISDTALADEMLIVDKLGKPWGVGNFKDVMMLIYREMQ